MASVPSLDKDLRNLRLEKYTPQRANETRQWIESILGERLPVPDLLDSLKDGTVLCRLANLVLGDNGVRFKKSAMPFVQMENISHFLRACQSPPLNLPPHDCFLTVDLYEQKDPAQVLQCIASFSRRAAALQPSQFPTDIGGKKATAISPQSSGVAGTPSSPGYRVPHSPAGRASPSRGATTSSPGASTWSRKADIGNESPAWNIAQYGWTGGASQGNQGIAFGAPRQLVSQQPHVPSLAEKERIRKQKAEEAERQRQAEEEEAERRRIAIEDEERKAQAEEARRWEAEAKRQREAEESAAEAEKIRWQEEERKWRDEDEQRKKEEQEAEARLEKERSSRPVLQGQYLSQYKAGQSRSPAPTPESDRIKELERQLEEARERERKYETERSRLGAQKTGSSHAGSAAAPVEEIKSIETSKPPVQDEWDKRDTERSFLRQQWKQNQESPSPLPSSAPRPLPVPGAQVASPASSRPLPIPTKSPAPTPGPKPIPKPVSVESTPEKAPTSPRPLPNPSTYVAPPSLPTTRTDAFLASNPAPEPAKPTSHTPSDAAFSSTAERAAEDARREASQQKTRAGGFASKSLLEREMERERERQREWEEGQKATKAAIERGDVDENAGIGPGQSWDVNSYGYMGGDNLNKSNAGVYSGRRQIIGGPRPMGGGGGK